MTTTGTPAATLPVDLGTGPFDVVTKGLVKRFGQIAALDGLDLQVPRGAVYVLVGPNGAGKSTLLRTLMGLVRRDGGEASVLGEDPRLRPGDVRARIGYVPEGHTVGYPWMTVGRLLEHYQAYYTSWDAEYAERLAKAYEVDMTRRCRTLSKGQARRVQLLLALAPRPPLLLLDEPTDGLDHVVRDATLAILSEHLADTGATVLISTHRVYEVERLVDHVGFLSGGRLVGQMPRDHLLANLRRYWVDAPESWNGSAELEGLVIRRAGVGREVEWAIWGNQETVVQGLTRSGARVRDVAPVTMDDAAMLLLSRREGP